MDNNISSIDINELELPTKPRVPSVDVTELQIPDSAMGIDVSELELPPMGSSKDLKVPGEDVVAKPTDPYAEYKNPKAMALLDKVLASTGYAQNSITDYVANEQQALEKNIPTNVPKDQRSTKITGTAVAAGKVAVESGKQLVTAAYTFPADVAHGSLWLMRQATAVSPELEGVHTDLEVATNMAKLRADHEFMKVRNKLDEVTPDVAEPVNPSDKGTVGTTASLVNLGVAWESGVKAFATKPSATTQTLTRMGLLTEDTSKMARLSTLASTSLKGAAGEAVLVRPEDTDRFAQAALDATLVTGLGGVTPYVAEGVERGAAYVAGKALKGSSKVTEAFTMVNDILGEGVANPGREAVRDFLKGVDTDGTALEAMTFKEAIFGSVRKDYSVTPPDINKHSKERFIKSQTPIADPNAPIALSDRPLVRGTEGGATTPVEGVGEVRMSSLEGDSKYTYSDGGIQTSVDVNATKAEWADKGTPEIPNPEGMELPSSVANDAAIQSKITQTLEKKLRTPEGATRQSVYNAYVNSQHWYENLQRTIKDSPTRFLAGQANTIALYEHGGARTAYEGATAGFEGSKLLSVLGKDGTVKTFDDVKNLKGIYIDAFELNVKNGATPEGAFADIEKYSKSLNTYDEYKKREFEIQEHIETITNKLGLGNIFEAKESDELTTKADIVLDLFSDNHSGDISYSKLNDKRFIGNAKSVLGQDVEKELDGILKLASIKLEIPRDQVMKDLTFYEAEPWAKQLKQDRQAYNKAWLGVEVEAGTISRKTADKWFASNPNYVPMYKENDFLNLPGSNAYRDDAQQRGGTFWYGRTINDYTSKDPLAASLLYMQARSQKTTKSIANNLILKDLLTNLDDYNFGLMFAQDRQKVLDAFNKAALHEGDAPLSFRADHLLPDKVKATAENTLQLGNNTVFNINGNELELTVLDGDAWATFRGLQYSNPKSTSGAMQLWGATNRLAKNFTVMVNPKIAVGVYAKEHIDSHYMSMLPPSRQVGTLTDRLKQWGELAHTFATRDQTKLLPESSLFHQNSGLAGLFSEVDYGAGPWNRAQVFERLIQGIPNGGYGRGGIRGAIEDFKDGLFKVQEGLDIATRAPEYKALGKAGLNPEDATIIARTGSTHFAQRGATVSEPLNKAFVTRLRDARDQAEVEWGKTGSREAKLKFDNASRDYNKAQLSLTNLMLSKTVNDIFRGTAFANTAMGSLDVVQKMMRYDGTKTGFAMLASGLAFTAAAFYGRGTEKALKDMNEPGYNQAGKVQVGDSWMVPTGFFGQVGNTARIAALQVGEMAAAHVVEVLPDKLKEEIRREMPELYLQINSVGGEKILLQGINNALQSLSQFSPGIGVGDMPIGLMTGVDPSTGRNIVNPVTEDLPYNYQHTSMKSAPSLNAATEGLANATNNIIDISPAYLQYMKDKTLGLVGELLVGSMDMIANQYGLVPEPPQEPRMWANANPLNNFHKDIRIGEDAERTSRAYLALGAATREVNNQLYSLKKLSDDNPENPKYAQQLVDFTLKNGKAMALNEIMAPYQKTIKGLYQQINDITKGTLPDTETPVSERHLFGSEKKRMMIDDVQRQIYSIQKDAINAVRSIPDGADLIEETIFKKEHPAWNVLTSAAYDKALVLPTPKSNMDVYKGQKQELAITKDEVNDIPIEAKKPKTDPKVVEKLANNLAVPTKAIADTIKQGAKATGVREDILYMFASIESSFKSGATNGGSVSGLFQFQDDTWKGVVAKWGEEYGITMKDKNDPYAQTVMAAELAKDEFSYFKLQFGHNPSLEDMYTFHLLGRVNATEFIGVLKESPYTSANKVLPKWVVDNNPSYFKEGSPTVKEAYDRIKTKVSTHKPITQ
jgi:hypothetical protein